MLLRYPGGKSRGPVRKRILDKLFSYLAANDYSEYREPFFGSGAIGFALLQHGVTKAWFNDRDPGIAFLWDAAFNHATGLEELIKGFEPSTEAYWQIKRDLLRPDYEDNPVVYGFSKLVLNRISHSGLGTMSGGPQGGRSGERIGERWLPHKHIADLRIIKRLVANVELHAGTCTCADFEQLLTARGRSLLYLDPPYHQKGPELYQYGFTHDHERLAACLQHCEHDWVLSYDDCEPIRALYSWAHIEVEPVTYSVSGPRHKTELVITRRSVT